MNDVGKKDVYKEELEFIFKSGGSGVRKVVVISALIEEQILLLAKKYLKKHGVEYEPNPLQAYYPSLNILKVNGELTSDELKELKNFRDNRNKAIHDIFKGFSREEWEEKNKQVIEDGRPIVKKLEKKLFLNHKNLKPDRFLEPVIVTGQPFEV